MLVARSQMADAKTQMSKTLGNMDSKSAFAKMDKMEQKIAAKEKWCDKRKQSECKEDAIITESIAEENASKALKIYDVADKLLEKIMFNLKNSDVLGSQEVKHYTSALKDIKEIKDVKSDIDLKEQNARIDKLRKEAEDEQTDTSIEVTMGSEVDKYAN